MKLHPAVILTAFLTLLAALPTGCGAELPTTADKCSDAYLAELTTRETAELIAACVSVPKDTPCEAAKPVREKYAALREEWTQCK